MPFGGLLSAGISAGGSLLGGLFGSKGAKKAAAAANQKSNDAITAQSNALGGNIDDSRDSEMRSNIALGDARDEGQQLIKSATTGGQGDVNTATQFAQQGVRQGVTDANTTLSDAQQKQLALYNPYIQAGTNSLTSLQQLAGPGGPLTNQFSFNPSDLQKDPGYAFTLQQGQDALQRSAAAKGQLFSSGTLKSLAGYTTGTANQYFNDAFNRSKTTFDTNQQQALSRISTLQGLAGLGSSSTNSAANSYGSAASQEAQNTLGGSEFIGNLAENGAQFGANLGEAGAQARSNLGASTASQISGNNEQGANQRIGARTQTASNVSNLLTGQGLTNANAVAGSTNSWLNTLNNGTNSALTYLAGLKNNSTTAGVPGYNPANAGGNLSSYDEFS